jgi:phospholipase C
VDAISPWHRAVSGDLTSAFDFASPEDSGFPTLPDVSNLAAVQTQSSKLPTANPPATSQPLFQETGVRYARALPYILHASAHVDASKGAVRLLFVNTGFQGAAFHVYGKQHLDLIPRRYTVEAGKMLDDEWTPTPDDDGLYDLWVLRPNGFHRHFMGNLSQVAAKNAPNPEIFVGYDVFGGGLHLQLRNDGGGNVNFTVKSNQIYGTLSAIRSSVSAFGPVPALPGFGPFPGFTPVGFGPVPGFGRAPVFDALGFGFSPPVFVPGPVYGPKATTSWNATVHAGRPNDLYWNLGSAALWYDFIITSDSDSAFQRRIAGHVETGRHSVSDPGLGLADQF